MPNLEQEMRDLCEYLNLATEAYEKGEPLISDRQWDKKYYELCKLEAETGKILSESPTQKIYFEIRDYLPKIKHDHPMLSLDKTKEISGVESFLGDREWVAMGKMDGLTCSLTYENGWLVRAETRGNGIEGEDILHNAKANLTIPQTIPYKKRVVIDGEIICTYKDFEKFKDGYKNPRNFAAGSIRLLNSKESRDRFLTFVAWDVIEFIDMPEDVKNPHSLILQLGKVEDWGFRCPAVCWNALGNSETVKEAIDYIRSYSEELGYPIDGVVFKFDDLDLRESLGFTSHHFNNAIAYKFFDELYETRLRDIEWTMGRTGVLTPVAIFDPVDADGSIIERANIHNVSVMESILGAAYKGQKLQVYKANQIIPQIDSAEPQEVGTTVEFIKIPKICPVCGQPTMITSSEDNVRLLVCSNPNCEGKLINKLDHYLGIKGINAKGISKATLEKLIEWGWITNICDLYNLREYASQWMKQDGFGEKSVIKILDSIENSSKELSLDKFLCAIGIPLVGSTVSKELAKIFDSYSDFRNAVDSGYKFYDLPNFGFEKHNAIMSFDYTQADILAKNYVKFSNKETTEVTNNLEGKTFVITGKLVNYKNRAALQQDIESHGGKVVGSVSKNTSYLINNDINSTSSKNMSAKKLNIPIITEEEFQDML